LSVEVRTVRTVSNKSFNWPPEPHRSLAVKPSPVYEGLRFLNPFSLFVSHATRDKKAVELVRSRIEPLGVSLYLAEHDNKAGERLSSKVEDSLSRSDAVLVLLTPNGYDSLYVQQEIGFATARNKLVIPLLAPELAGVSLGMLNDIEYILFDPTNPADGLARVSERVDALVRQRKANQDLVAVVGLVALIALVIYLDQA